MKKEASLNILLGEQMFFGKYYIKHVSTLIISDLTEVFTMYSGATISALDLKPSSHI